MLPVTIHNTGVIPEFLFGPHIMSQLSGTTAPYATYNISEVVDLMPETQLSIPVKVGRQALVDLSSQKQGGMEMDNSLISIAGICDVCKLELHDNDSWTEISVPENLILPDEKPDIEQILSVNIAARINRTEAVVTPSTERAPSFEGKCLTGRKLIVEGALCQTITYTAALPTQPVHSAHFAVPFSAYIVIPRHFIFVDDCTCFTKKTDSLCIKFRVSACVEDVLVQEVGKRQISKSVLLFLHAVPTVTDHGHER